MVIDMVPVVGFAVAGVILVVGHIFNLGINALGAFIHSGRLQFVEFFPKFIEGGGVPFRPFGRIGKYVDDPSEFN
jgi:V/A-type H+-transporting ATPase subunit I